MSNTAIESSKILDSLKHAVENALLKKQRLGQYAVFVKDNAPKKFKGYEILLK